MGKRDFGRREQKKPKKTLQKTSTITSVLPATTANVEVVKKRTKREEGSEE